MRGSDHLPSLASAMMSRKSLRLGCGVRMSRADSIGVPVLRLELGPCVLSSLIRAFLVGDLGLSREPRQTHGEPRPLPRGETKAAERQAASPDTSGSDEVPGRQASAFEATGTRTDRDVKRRVLQPARSFRQ